MAQEIRNRRGNLVVSIPDGVVLMPPDPTVSSDGPTVTNTNTSLFQIGRDVLDYGLEMSENLHWVMENFANSVPPQNPVDGQLWWDLSSSASPVMRVYNTSTGGWGPVVRLASDTNPTLSANLNAAGRKINNLGTPTSAQDAATKQYVDTAISAVAGGSASFLGLTDTPSTYSGQAGKITRVNATNTGLEFYKLKFTDLDGIPSGFTGQGGKYLRVNAASTALEYITPNISHIDWSGAISINAQGVRITNIANPTAAQDAASKAYVDSSISTATGGVLPSSDGIIVKSGSSSVSRSVVPGNDGIIVANGNGVGGNITISHKSTGAASSNNSGNNFIQSINLDSYGHINSITTGTVAGSLGYTPLNKAGDMMQGALTLLPGISNGLRFPPNPYGGAGDLVTITLESAGGDASGPYGSGERQRLRFRVANDGGNNTVDDKAEFIVPDNASLLVNNNVVWNAGYQGPGTGMNSDLLDGYDWTSGQDVSFGLGRFLTPNAGTTGGIQLRANPSHGSAILQFVNSAINAQYGFLAVGSDGKLIYNNGTVWHSLLQGPGTGMNADMVDGKHYADIIADAAANSNGIVAGSLGNNGWIKFGFGNLMIQWGRWRYTSNNRQVFTVPYNVSFSGQAYAVTAFRYDPTGRGYNQKKVFKYGDGDASNFYIYMADDDSGDSGSYLYGLDWIAIGPA